MRAWQDGVRAREVTRSQKYFSAFDYIVRATLVIFITAQKMLSQHLYFRNESQKQVIQKMLRNFFRRQIQAVQTSNAIDLRYTHTHTQIFKRNMYQWYEFD